MQVGGVEPRQLLVGEIDLEIPKEIVAGHEVVGIRPTAALRPAGAYMTLRTD
jgi:hypothetical protein